MGEGEVKRLRRWLIGKLTVVDLVEYFNSMDIMIYLRYMKKDTDKEIKKQHPVYYAKNSRMYKRTFD